MHRNSFFFAVKISLCAENVQKLLSRIILYNIKFSNELNLYKNYFTQKILHENWLDKKVNYSIQNLPVFKPGVPPKRESGLKPAANSVRLEQLNTHREEKQCQTIVRTSLYHPEGGRWGGREGGRGRTCKDQWAQGHDCCSLQLGRTLIHPWGVPPVQGERCVFMWGGVISRTACTCNYRRFTLE